MAIAGRLYLAQSATCREVHVRLTDTSVHMIDPRSETLIREADYGSISAEQFAFSPVIDLTLHSGERLVIEPGQDKASLLQRCKCQSAAAESQRKPFWLLMCMTLLPVWFLAFFLILIPLYTHVFGDWVPAAWVSASAAQSRQQYESQAPKSFVSYARYRQHFYRTWERMMTRAGENPADFPVALHAAHPQAQAFYAFADGSLAVDDSMLALIAIEPDLLPVLAMHELGHQRALHKMPLVQPFIKGHFLPSVVPQGALETLVGWLNASDTLHRAFTDQPYSDFEEWQAQEYADWMLIRQMFDRKMIENALARLNQQDSLPKPLQNYLRRHPYLQKRLAFMLKQREYWQY